MQFIFLKKGRFKTRTGHEYVSDNISICSYINFNIIKYDFPRIRKRMKRLELVSG